MGKHYPARFSLQRSQNRDFQEIYILLSEIYELIALGTKFKNNLGVKEW